MTDTVAVQSFAGALGMWDFVVLAVAVGGLLLIAYWSGRRESDTADFFLGGRRVPTLVACLSFVATEISAMTIVTVPAVGYSENWFYLQFFIGSAAAKLVIAFLFIPSFYKYKCTTIYEFLRHRFGPETQVAGSAFFFVTRLLASGVRLFVACKAVAVILDLSPETTLVLFTVVSTAFIAFGGIKAVVWTGAFEAAVFFVAGFAVVGYLLWSLTGGLADAWRLADHAGRLDFLNLGWNLGDPKTLWGAAFNAFFVGLAVFGADQEMMQRLLTLEPRRKSQRALVTTILAAFPLLLTYLVLGTLLYVFYAQHPGQTVPAKSDDILSYFTVHVLPAGLKGLVLAAIILASIDSPLSSLASSFVTDVYRPLIRRAASERHYLWVSRLGVVGFGVLLVLIAYPCRYFEESMLWVGQQVFTVTGGAALGVFLLGLLTRRRANRGNVVAMILSTAVVLGLMVGIKVGKVHLGWSWLIVIGTAATFGLGYLFSFFEKPPDAEAGPTADA